MNSSLQQRSVDFDGDSPFCEMDMSSQVQTQFQHAEFGDERLTDRLVQLEDELGSSPTESIHIACENTASTEATYRFCDNGCVNGTEIHPHRQAQQARVQETDEFLVVSDTTELTFLHHPAKEDLGDIGAAKMDTHGVKAHSTIDIDPQTHHMTGVIDQHSTSAHSLSPKPPNSRLAQ